MATTVSQENWDTLLWYVVQKDAPVAVDAQAVWRRTVQQRVWLVLPVNCCQRQTVRHCFANWILKITSLDVSIAAGKGDELAKEIYEFTGKMLGEACADFAAFSSPEAFIFFGGMVKAGDLIMEPIKRAYNEHVMTIFKNKAQFLVSGLDGASAAVLGASAIGWEIQ